MQSNFKYAKTLFDLSQKSDNINLIHSELKAVVSLYNKVPALRLVFITKRIDADKKIEIIKNTLNKFHILVIEFISILIQNNQTNILSDVVSRFNSMVNSSVSSVKVEITTSEKLNDIDLQYISQSIHSTLNTSSTINVKTDSSILGGIKLRVGNKIFDNSVSYQINQLKKTLHNL